MTTSLDAELQAQREPPRRRPGRSRLPLRNTAAPPLYTKSQGTTNPNNQNHRIIFIDDVIISRWCLDLRLQFKTFQIVMDSWRFAFQTQTPSTIDALPPNTNTNNEHKRRAQPRYWLRTNNFMSGLTSQMNFQPTCRASLWKRQSTVHRLPDTFSLPFREPSLCGVLNTSCGARFWARSAV